MTDRPDDLPYDPFDVARSGVFYLASLISPSGRFRYRFDHATWRDFGGYNALRHCGSIWAMCDVADRLGAPQAVLKTIERAIGHLRDAFLRRSGDGKRLDVVERGSVKLGGNALAVLALLGAAKVLRNRPLLEIAVDLGGSILADQKAEGDFIHKTDFKTRRDTGYHSEYYTGEALLALMSLHAATGEARWADAAMRAEALLGPQDYGVAEQSHWMLYSLEALARHRDDPAYHAHARKIVAHILEFPNYLAWKRSTPTACRSEGLLAFLRMSDGRAEAADLRAEVRAAVENNLREQMRHRRPDGAFVRGGVKDRRRGAEVRIDYVQHNVSAFLHYGALDEVDEELGR